MNDIASVAPVILTAAKSSLSDLADQFYQCDCACPDNRLDFSADRAASQRVLGMALHHPWLHTQSLSSDHTLIFNPNHNAGVAVLNDAARRVWLQFKSPCAVPAGVGEQFAATVIRLVEAGALVPLDAEAHPQKGRPQVLSAWIHVSNQCQLRCDYCYIRKSDDDMSEEVGRAAVDAILRSASLHGFRKVKLKFAGGEAILNLKRVFDIHTYALEQARSRGLQIDAVVLSNGVSIGERAISEFITRGIRISISLDGVGATHDAQRKLANGNDSFHLVDRTLSRLIGRGIKPFVSITLSGRNAADLPNTLRYVIEKKLPFNINFYRENDCASSMTDLRLKDDLIIASLEQAFDFLEANLPEHSLLGSLIDRAQFDQPHDKTCGVGESYIVVDHEGNVAKCQMEIERPVTSVYADDPLGFIRADSIGLQNPSVEEKEGCRACEWKYFCAGGCPALTFRVTGRYDVKSPNCRIYKSVFPRLLLLEAQRILRDAQR